jgi:hypothetical protein
MTVFGTAQPIPDPDVALLASIAATLMNDYIKLEEDP